MKIFSIITTYNGEKWIEKNLDSLGRSGVKVYSIVIDNGSEDNTVRIIKEKFPECYLVENKENLGFAQGNNIGIRYALSRGADYVLLLNQDVKVDPLMVEAMLTCLEANPEYGFVSPLHLDYEGAGIDQLFLKYIGMNSRLISDAILGRFENIYEMTFTNAAAWLLTRRLLEDVGGFDPLFFVYGEDGDFCQRARFHGYKNGVVPRAVVYHWHMADRMDRPSGRHRCNWIYSWFIYKLKNPERTFLRNLVSLIFAFFVELERKLESLDFKGCIITFYCIVKIGTKIFTVRKHHDMCKTRGCHWL
jgi:GT2 family glycosyltransferase